MGSLHTGWSGKQFIKGSYLLDLENKNKILFKKSSNKKSNGTSQDLNFLLIYLQLLFLFFLYEPMIEVGDWVLLN